MKALIKKVMRLLTDGDYRFVIFANQGFYNRMDDREYLMRMYRALMKKELNLDDPKTYNEKLQWLKLYDRKPFYSQMVDKLAAKDYVAHTIGGQYVIPTLKVWDKAEEIDLDVLPEQFVLKCTHDSHDLVICKDKKNIKKDEVIKKFKHGLKQDYYLKYREWPYKNVKPRVIAEQYLENNEKGELQDYKFYCFDGKVRLILIIQGRFSGQPRMDFFDAEYNHMDFIYKGEPNANIMPKLPDNCDEMVRLAEELSQGIPAVRVDFYDIQDKIYFGEFTFFSASGFRGFQPESWDEKIGSWISLP